MGSAQASDFLENAFIDHVFRTRTWTKPAALWVALFTAAPSDAGGGTEVAGGGYARVNLPPSDTNWQNTQGNVSGNSTGTTGLTSNAVAITFQTPTALWGAVTHFGIFDAATGGNLLIWDQLTIGRTIGPGDPAPAFPISTLQIKIQ